MQNTIDNSNDIYCNGHVVTKVVVLPDDVVVYRRKNATVAPLPTGSTVKIIIGGVSQNVGAGDKINIEEGSTIDFEIDDPAYTSTWGKDGYWGVEVSIGNSIVYSQWKTGIHTFSYTATSSEDLTIRVTALKYYSRMVYGTRFKNNTDQPGIQISPMLDLYTINSNTGAVNKWQGMTIYDMNFDSQTYYDLPTLYIGGRTTSKPTGKTLKFYSSNVTHPSQAWRFENYLLDADSVITPNAPRSSGLSNSFSITRYASGTVDQTADIIIGCSCRNTEKLWALYVRGNTTNKIKVQKYNAAAFETISSSEYYFFSSRYIDITCVPLSASKSAINAIEVRLFNDGTNVNQTFYQGTSRINPYGNISQGVNYYKGTEYCNTAIIDASSTVSLTNTCYAYNTNTGSWGDWTSKVVNNSPVRIYYEYSSQKVSNSHTSFDRNTYTDSGITDTYILTDQGGFGDDRFHIKASGFEQTSGGKYPLSGPELWIKSGNGYLY